MKRYLDGQLIKNSENRKDKSKINKKRRIEENDDAKNKKTKLSFEPNLVLFDKNPKLKSLEGVILSAYMQDGNICLITNSLQCEQYVVCMDAPNWFYMTLPKEGLNSTRDIKKLNGVFPHANVTLERRRSLWDSKEQIYVKVATSSTKDFFTSLSQSAEAQRRLGYQSKLIERNVSPIIRFMQAHKLYSNGGYPLVTFHDIQECKCHNTRLPPSYHLKAKSLSFQPDGKIANIPHETMLIILHENNNMMMDIWVCTVQDQESKGLIYHYHNEAKKNLTDFANLLAKRNPDVLVGPKIKNSLKRICQMAERFKIPLSLNRVPLHNKNLISGNKSSLKGTIAPGRILIDLINYGLEFEHPKQVRGVIRDLALTNNIPYVVHRHWSLKYYEEELNAAISLYKLWKPQNAIYCLSYLCGIFGEDNFIPVRRTNALFYFQADRYQRIVLDRIKPLFIKPGGGRLSENIPGLFRKVLTFDSVSNYATIMSGHNIELSYAQKHYQDKIQRLESRKAVPMNQAELLVATTKHQGIPSFLAQLSDYFIEQRKLATTPLQKKMLKVIYTNFYGTLGNQHFEFYTPECPDTVAHYGRDLHELMENLAKSSFPDGKVVFGYTDSIAIHLPSSDSDDTSEELEKQGQLFATKLTDILQKVTENPKLHIKLETIYEYLFVGNTHHKYWGWGRKAGESKYGLVTVGLEGNCCDSFKWLATIEHYCLEMFFKLLTVAILANPDEKLRLKEQVMTLCEKKIQEKTSRENLYVYYKCKVPSSQLHPNKKEGTLSANSPEHTINAIKAIESKFNHVLPKGFVAELLYVHPVGKQDEVYLTSADFEETSNDVIAWEFYQEWVRDNVKEILKNM